MRGWLKATIGLVVLSGLLVGADRVAVGVAEDQAADQLVKSGFLSQRPQVSIEGFPFLTQALSMELDDVRLSADGLMVGTGQQQVDLHAFTARLSGVAVSGSFRSATVASGTAAGLISYEDLARMMPPASQLVPGSGKLIPGNTRLALSYGGPGKIKASLGPVPVGEGSLQSSGNTITADGFRLSGVAALFNGGDKALDPVSFTLSSLPAGLTLAGVEPQSDGLRLSFRGERLSLTG